MAAAVAPFTPGFAAEVGFALFAEVGTGCPVAAIGAATGVPGFDATAPAGATDTEALAQYQNNRVAGAG